MVGAVVGIVAGWACVALLAVALCAAGVTGDALLWASLGCGLALYLAGAALIWRRTGLR